METIKKYLEEFTPDENQINDFLKGYEFEIKSFFKTLWERQSAQPLQDTSQVEIVEITTEQPEEQPLETQSGETPDTNGQPEAEIEIQTTDNQTQTDMPIFFNPEEKPDKEKAQNEALNFQIKNKQITFQNGKVNQEYCVDFDIETLQIQDIASGDFDGLEKIGLQYFPGEKKIKGMPTEAGDHKIMLNLKRKDWTEGKPVFQREVIFIINPDPRVLWSKNIPSEQDETKMEYPKPDSAKEFVKVAAKIKSKYCGLKKTEIARKDMVAASQRGRSHAIEGKPRDDDFALYFDEETECYIMIVADGAGSAKYSRKGSQIACNTAMNVCKEKLLANKEIFLKYSKKTQEDTNEIGKILWETISNAVYESYRAIENEVKEKTHLAQSSENEEEQKKTYSVKDYATTLIISICKKFEYGWFTGTWWVGDGGIGIYNKDTRLLKILGEPDGGEFAGQTRFLTMPDIIKNEFKKRMKLEIVEDFTAIILMTDGVTDPKFETDANLNRIEKWDELWDDLNGSNEDNVKVDFSDDNEQVAGQLLKWLDFWSKGNHDDRTIAILF